MVGVVDGGPDLRNSVNQIAYQLRRQNEGQERTPLDYCRATEAALLAAETHLEDVLRTHAGRDAFSELCQRALGEVRAARDIARTWRCVHVPAGPPVSLETT